MKFYGSLEIISGSIDGDQQISGSLSVDGFVSSSVSALISGSSQVSLSGTTGYSELIGDIGTILDSINGEVI